jgi:hypothetical protein
VWGYESEPEEELVSIANRAENGEPSSAQSGPRSTSDGSAQTNPILPNDFKQKIAA